MFLYRMFYYTVILSFFFIFITTTIYPKTIVVDNNPNCLLGICFSCIDTPRPFSSINKALKYANSGDKIKICKGTYQESINIKKNDITIQGVEDQKPEDVLINSGNKDGIIITGKNITIKNLSIKSNKRGIYGRWSSNGENFFQDLVINSRGDGIYISHGKSQHFKNIKIISGNKGIYLGYSVSGRHTFEDIVINSKSDGLYITNDAYKFKNITINSNRKGISITSSKNNLTFENIKIISGNYGIYFGYAANKNKYLENINITSATTGVYFSGRGNIKIKNANIVAKTRGIYISFLAFGKHELENLNIKSYYEAIYAGKGFYKLNNAKLVSNGSTAIKIFPYKDLTIENANIVAHKKGIYFMWGNYVTITLKSINISADTDDGIYLSSAKNFYINGLCIKKAGKYGIHTSLIFDNLNIKNSSIQNTKDYGLFLTYTFSFSKGKIENNCFYGSRLAANYSRRFIFTGNYYNGVIDRNNDGCISRVDSLKIGYGVKDCKYKKSCEINVCKGIQFYKPIAEYRMDECIWNGEEGEVIDSSGNNYNGTSHLSKTESAKSTGRILCRVGDFTHQSSNDTVDSDDDFVVLPSQVLNGLKDFTIMAWIKTTQSGYHKRFTILSGANDSTGNEVWMYFTDKNKFYPWIKGKRKGTIKLNKNLNDGRWHHIVWTRSEIKNCIIIDGDVENKKCIEIKGSDGPLNVQGLVLGQDQDKVLGGYESYQEFNGYMDELKIFNKVVSDEQIQTIYNNEKAGKNYDGSNRECETCLLTAKADWHFDECSWKGLAGEVKDNSSNGFDGTAINGTATKNDGVICNSAYFNGIDNYIRVENLSSILNSTSSLSFWIKTTQKGNNIDWKAPGIIGVEQYGGINDIFWGWIDANGHIGISKGNNSRNSKSTIPINDGRWHHVVLTRNSKTGKVKIYIDGKLNKVGYTDRGDVTTRYSSIGRIENTNPKVPMKYFKGYLDELKVFDKVLSDKEVEKIYNYEKNKKNWWDGTVRECHICSTVTHYEIIHDSDALTCTPENITIKACANDDCSLLSSKPSIITLTPSGWVGGDTKTFTGQNTFQLSHTKAETVILGMENQNPPADYCCKNPEIDDKCVNDYEHCKITFHDSGLIFDVPYTQISGKESNKIMISAVQKDDKTNKCIPAFQNVEKNIKFWFNYQNPSSNPSQEKLYIKGNSDGKFNSLPTKEPFSPNVKIHFNENGEGYFLLNYYDAGRLNLFAKYEDSSGLILTGEDVYGGSGNGFVFKPWAFYVDIPGNPSAKDSNGGVFKRAGENFTIKILPVCYEHGDNKSRNSDLENNKVTTNFNSEITISHSLILPADGDQGKLKVTSFNLKNGNFQIDNESFSEVGIISINVTCPDYLNSGQITGHIPFVGRFIPHHFFLTEKKDGQLHEICNGIFNFIGLKTYYDTIPEFKIVAKNRDNETTKNYKGNFFKLSLSSFNIKYPDHDDFQLGKDNSTKLEILLDNSPDALTSNEDGSATYSFGNDNVTYIRNVNSKVAPFTPHFSFIVNNVSDSDGVNSINTPFKISVSGLQMKYGRLNIIDNYGPETENLKMKVYSEYYNGSNWNINRDDSCTILSKDDFKLDNFTDNLNREDTNIISTDGISNGKGYIILKAPLDTNYGSVTIKLNPSSILYNYLNDPETPGIATFGIYRGRDRIILWKEIPIQ